MSDQDVLRPQPAVDDFRRPSLLGGIGRSLATGLALYRGWYT